MTTPLPVTRSAMLISLALFAIACAKDKDSAVPADVQQAVASAPATPAAPSAATVDVCAMLTKADVEAVIGALSKEPKAATPTGSLLGQCEYTSMDLKAKPMKVTIAMVSAHPAGEFDGTMKMMAKRSPLTPVSGLGSKAFDTQSGLMILPAGKPYFLSVVIADKNGKEMSLKLARKLKM
jgi:hypothetical protein